MKTWQMFIIGLGTTFGIMVLSTGWSELAGEVTAIYVKIFLVIWAVKWFMSRKKPKITKETKTAV